MDRETAVKTLERAVAEEPAWEKAHAALMRLYVLTGQRQKALRQYEQLKGALSVDPGAQSRRLYEEILVGQFPAARRPYAEPLPGKPPGTRPHNLPAARTSFIGREREVSEVKRLLVTTRLLTLTGAGGCGKTRLALEVARDLVAACPDGVWLAELASITDHSLVPRTVARVFGVREPPNCTLADALVDVLRAKRTLLVLDNCEHVVDATARLVETLLDNCPDLRVLATSREVLGVSGEVSWPVPALSVPDPEQASTLEELEKSESAQLFVDRALQRPAAFVLTEQNASTVAEICRGLDGLPLAIELAAARVGGLTLEQISGRLTGALKLLSAGPRTAEPRHQTLRGALDWSYELLDDKEQELFRELSAFAGGWTLEAAEAVGAGDDILDLLSSLVDKSLVVTGVPEPARYRLLEPVRQYALERLEESGEAEEVRRRHALWCLELAERAEPELTGPDQVKWLERLEAEHDNIRSALGWAFEAGETELGLKLAAALWLFWYTHGHPSEGRGWLERGISELDVEAPRLRAKALNGAGWIALFQPDYEAAEEFLEESLALYRELEDKEGIASCLVNLGFVALLGERNLEFVPAYTEEAVRLRPEIEDRRTIANMLVLSGLVSASGGDLEGTLTSHEEALALHRQTGDKQGATMCLVNLGLLALIQGDHTPATARLREVLHLSLESDDKLAFMYALWGLAGVAASLQRPARAARLWGAAQTVCETYGLHPSSLAISITGYEARLARVREQLGDDALETEWEKGKAMTREEAVECALAEESQPATQPLTRREREIAELVARGLTNRPDLRRAGDIGADGRDAPAQHLQEARHRLPHRSRHWSRRTPLKQKLRNHRSKAMEGERLTAAPNKKIRTLTAKNTYT